MVGMDVIKAGSFETALAEANPAVPMISLDQLSPRAWTGQHASPSFQSSVWSGEKFPTGMPSVQHVLTDYWALRGYSAQFFQQNLYARGLIRRLVTNAINTGLEPDAFPDADVLGIDGDTLIEWGENVENLYIMWGKNPAVCDFKKKDTLGRLQAFAYLEALVAGDVLVVLRTSRVTKMQSVQLVSGEKVRTPLMSDMKALKAGHTVVQGVEMDASGRVVAYWIKQDNTKDFERLPANGERSGRRIAWLVFGTDKRFDEVRGQPLLSLIIQSLNELDRYRDSVQRKAVINSILAMFIEKTEDKMGTLPGQGGAVRVGTSTSVSADGTTRQFNIANQIPGILMEELQVGEKPQGFSSQGIDTDFPTFEAAIVNAMAWATEIPPEILTLAFSNNYSASAAAINEFKIFLFKVWGDWGTTFCQPIFIEWLISSTLLGIIQSPGLIESWRDPRKYTIFGAWTVVSWWGVVKPSTDMVKSGKASEMLIAMGLTTRAREARQLTGTKFTRNIKQQIRENELLALARRPMLELEKEFGIVGVVEEDVTPFMVNDADGTGS